MLTCYVKSLPAIIGVVLLGLVPHMVLWSALIVCAHAGVARWKAFAFATAVAAIVVCAMTKIVLVLYLK